MLNKIYPGARSRRPGGWRDRQEHRRLQKSLVTSGPEDGAATNTPLRTCPQNTHKAPSIESDFTAFESFRHGIIFNEGL